MMDSDPQTVATSPDTSSREVEKLEDGTANASSKEAEPELAPPPPPPHSKPPPNGGFKAWLQVLGSWMLIFNTWGTPPTNRTHFPPPTNLTQES
jgi:hypothetical protein